MTIELAPAANIAKLLKDSLIAHERCAQVRRANGDWKPIMQQAYDLRSSAHDADPDHLDPAWAIEEPKTNTAGSTHDQMMAFYGQLLGIPYERPARAPRPVAAPAESMQHLSEN